MNLLFALLMIGCLFRTAELLPTEQPLFGNVTEEEIPGPFYEPTNSSEEFPTGSNAGCSLYEVQCYNSTRCIWYHWICDNYTDCEDNSDEIDCYRKETFFEQFITPEYQTTKFTGCSPNEVQCYNSTSCIPAHWVCDNYTDCEDNSDEIDCYRREYLFLDQFTTPESQNTEFTDCNVNQVKCYNSNKCIPNHWICDNYTDCDDNSDEIDCYRKETFFYQFTTPESQTTEFTGCIPNEEVQCNNSTQCIPASYVCDNYTDCDDYSDEIGCYGRETFFYQHTTPKSQTGCNMLQVQCYNSTRCIPNDWVCDNYTDCEDNSDEIDCYRKEMFFVHFTTPESRTTKFTGCSPNEVQCYNSTSCIPAHWVCDNYTDCEDNSDEIDCYRREIFLDRQSTYRPFFDQQSSAFPRSQTFPPANITAYKTHEATNQPSFHQPSTPERQTFQTGESFANFVTKKPRSKPKTKRPCSKKSFYCGDSCISKSLVCDGKQDCFDGRDEFNCAPTGRK